MLRVDKARALAVPRDHVPARERPPRAAALVEVDAALGRDVDASVVIHVADDDVVREMPVVNDGRSPGAAIDVGTAVVQRIVQNRRDGIESADDDVGGTVAVDVGRLRVFAAEIAAADACRRASRAVQREPERAGLRADHGAAAAGVDDDLCFAPVALGARVDDDARERHRPRERAADRSQRGRLHRVDVVLACAQPGKLVRAGHLPCAGGEQHDREDGEDGAPDHVQLAPIEDNGKNGASEGTCAVLCTVAYGTPRRRPSKGRFCRDVHPGTLGKKSGQKRLVAERRRGAELHDDGALRRIHVQRLAAGAARVHEVRMRVERAAPPGEAVARVRR